MTVHVAVASRNAGLNASLDLADAGSGAATIEVRTGSQPANADTTATGTVLVTFTCADPAWGAASAGVKTLAGAPRTATAAATGTAGWARMKDSTGATIFDGSVGTTGTDFIINSTSITSGQTVNLTSGTITDPA